MTEHIQTREFTDNLLVQATPEQTRENLQKLKIHTRKLQELKDQRRSSTSNFNQAIKYEEGVIKDLGEQDEQMVRVPTRVREERDFQEGVLRRIRLDTGEAYQERPLTDDERQMEVAPAESGDPPPEKKGPGRPRGAKNKAKAQDPAPEAPAEAQEPDADEEPRAGFHLAPTHLCENCGHDFHHAGGFDPTVVAECPKCHQHMAQFIGDETGALPVASPQDDPPEGFAETSA